MDFFRDRITTARKMLSTPMTVDHAIYDDRAKTVRIFLELEDHTIVEAEIIGERENDASRSAAH